MEISSAVEIMVLRDESKLGKNETYNVDTLIIHDTACAYIFISTAFYTLKYKLMLILPEVHCLRLSLHD